MNEKSRRQIVLITGAGSGFGRATAIELARAGHIVYASMRRDDLERHSKERCASMMRSRPKSGWTCVRSSLTSKKRQAAVRRWIG
jgi:NAD(P)-dependent dehydrogenase (short-subunit alcohol dehydrogenase family)